MAVTVSSLISDTLQRLHLTQGSSVAALFSGGSAAIVPGRDTEDFLLQQFRECLTLLCSPSQYNCVLLRGSGTATVTLATWGGVVDGATLTPPLWRVESAKYNGYGLEQMGGVYARLYCNDSDIGIPATFTPEGARVTISPVPAASGGVTTATVALSGLSLPTLPDDVNDSVDLTAGGIGDDDLRYLLVRYGAMMICDMRQDDQELQVLGGLAEEEFCRRVWAIYMNLPAQVRESAFRAMTSPPMRNGGTLVQRKRAEA